MADFDKNEDQIVTTVYGVKGIQYDVIDDLDSEPVDVAFFKSHARIDFDTDDALVSSYLKAARQELEQWSQLSFGVKTMRLIALEIPKNYKLLFGRVGSITTTGYTLLGDRIRENAKDVTIEYVTEGTINEAIKIAICRYAAGLYINRENITETQFSAQALQDEAKVMIRPFANITLW